MQCVVAFTDRITGYPHTLMKAKFKDFIESFIYEVSNTLSDKDIKRKLSKRTKLS